MSKKTLLVGLVCSILSGCAAGSFSFLKPSPKLTACDDIAVLGYQYFKHYEASFNGKAIATAKLRLFNQPNVVSRLDVSRNLVNPIVQQRSFELSLDDKVIPVNRRYRDYVALFVPQSLASKHFGQTEVTFTNERFLHAAFLLIPSESFYKGVCRSGIKPILLGSIKSDENDNIPQIMIGKTDIKTLATSLFLDPKSDLEEEIRKYYNDKLINYETWGGWVDVEISLHHSGWLRHLWSKLTKSQLGRYGVVGDIGSYSVSISSPSLEEMVDEQKRIRGGWRDVLKRLNKKFSEINNYLVEMDKMLSDGEVNGKKFAELSNKAANLLDIQAEKIKTYREGIPKDLFVTMIESNYLQHLLNEKLDKVENRYIDVVGKYTEILSNAEYGQVNPDIIMNRGPLVVGETRIRPVKKAIEISIGERKIPMDSVVFLEQVEASNNYKVRMIALADLSESMDSLQKEAVEKLKASLSGSLKLIREPAFEKGQILDKGSIFSKKLNFDYQLTIEFKHVPYGFRFCGHWYNPWKICVKYKDYKSIKKDTIYGNLVMKVIPTIKPVDAHINHGYYLCSKDKCPKYSDKMSSKKSTEGLFSLLGLVDDEKIKNKRLSFVDGVGGNKYLMLVAETKQASLNNAIPMLNSFGSGK